MLTCFKAKERHELERLANEISGLREDIKGLQQKSSNDQPAVSSQSPGTNKTASASASASVEKTKLIKTNGDMSNPDDCDVMISLNCRTMLPTAQRFRDFLEAHGVKVWLCVNMSAGVDFRDEIIAAVDSCEVFLPLINEAWCESKECKYEFNYCFRRNLTSEPQCPAIIPMCFPDLQWNAHAHVRALLANTNALVYKDNEEQEVLERLIDALKANGLEMKNTQPSKWTSEDSQKYMQQMILSSFEHSGKELDGKSLLEMNADSFEEVITRAAKNMKHTLGKLEEEACAEMEDDLCLTDSTASDGSSSGNGEASYDGMYKVIAKTTNYYDQNVTESNVFLVTLQRNGIGSSGCAWTAGSIHNNYDGVTSIWQGEFASNGSFHFTSLYSNDTKEEYSGRFEKCGGDDGNIYARGKYCKYAWFGYGNESYGMLDMMMCKLSPEEEREAKEAMQTLALGDSNAISLEAIMQQIGPTMAWGDFHKAADSYPHYEIDGRGFCLTPAYNASVCLGAPIAVHFELPDGYTAADNCVVSIIPKGTEEIDDVSFFHANEYTVARGYVFPTQKVPADVGPYEIALFNSNGQKIGHNPISITHGNSWKK